MNLYILNDNEKTKKYKIEKDLFEDLSFENKTSYILANTKEECALKIYKTFFSNAKSILFDQENKPIKKMIKNLNIKEFSENSSENMFTKHNFSLLYFTSGSTGFPVGALKTKENILYEIAALSNEINKSKIKIKKVIATTPFVHYYGSLMGLFYPLQNNIELIFKEHFLPHDLLEICENNTLIITTPLYIKALNKINQKKDLSKAIFISSTAPLLIEDAKDFKNKFGAKIMQIFGSTETGGIAYKWDDEILWAPLQDVKISKNNKNELKINSPFVSDVIYEQGFQTTKQSIQTSDYVEFEGNQFKLLGRSSQIVKIAGKRYSTVAMENILEKTPNIEAAIVKVSNDTQSLRGESLEIIIQSKQEITANEIKKILKNELSNIKFSISLIIVDKIERSSIGKKIFTK